MRRQSVRNGSPPNLDMLREVFGLDLYDHDPVTLVQTLAGDGVYRCEAGCHLELLPLPEAN